MDSSPVVHAGGKYLAIFLLWKAFLNRIFIGGNLILFYENYYTMTTLVGIFFSFISVLGLLKGKSKKFMRKTVIILFSFALIIGQLMFMYSKLAIESQEFIAISGLVSGVILILAFQKNEAW